jgi:hypothetical protein
MVLGAQAFGLQVSRGLRRRWQGVGVRAGGVRQGIQVNALGVGQMGYLKQGIGVLSLCGHVVGGIPQQQGAV